MRAHPGDWLIIERDGVERRGRRPATAVLIRDAPEATGAGGDLITVVSPVRARWTLPDGTERTGTVKASNGTKAGTPVPIWLDGVGNPVDAPVVRAPAHREAVSVAAWSGTAVCISRGGRS